MARKRKRAGGVSRGRGRRNPSLGKRLKRKAIAVVILLLLGGLLWFHTTEPQERARQAGVVRDKWFDFRETRRTGGEENKVSSWDTQYIPAGAEYIFAGIPRVVTYEHPVTVLENEGFVIGYCEYRKNPVWVGYRVDHREGTSAPQRPGRFRVDERTRSRINHDDYTGSGYDRGHMAPNHAIASRYGREAQLQTFLMSNISPQNPRLNRHTWRLLEERIAREYSRRYGSVWVILGPVFRQPVERLPSGVAIPLAFYKVIVAVDGGIPRAVALIVPQDTDGTGPKEQFLTSIRDVELQTGFNFFHELEDDFEAAWEAGVAERLW